MEHLMVTLIANAGVLLSYKNKRILIDGIHREAMPPFESVNKDLLNKIIAGQGFVGQLDIVLFTHDHKDHFDLASTTKFVEMNKKALVYGPKSLCHQLRQSLLDDRDRMRIMDTDISGDSRAIGDGIRLRSVAIPHEGKKYSMVENIAYLVEVEGIKVLHLGDAAISAMASSDYEVLMDHVDVALLNFPFVTLERGRQIIKDIIQPQKVYVLHLPNQLEDEFGWIGSTKDDMITYRDDLPEIEVLSKTF